MQTVINDSEQHRNIKTTFQKVIIMTLYNTSNPGTRSYTSDELMRRRREAVRDRRLREGALISGRVLSPDTHSNIIELYPVQLTLAQ